MPSKSSWANGKLRLTPIVTILIAWLIAGTLDILAAIIMYSFVRQNGPPIQLLHSIASGAFGKKAFNGGAATAMYGLAFHYLVALSFTITYFLGIRFIPFLHRQKVIAGLLYGIVVWLVMILIVLRIVFPTMAPLQPQGIITGMLILMVCIGLPISLVTNKYYAVKFAGA